MEVSLLCYVALALLLSYTAQRLAYGATELPPGPPGHPIIGHALKIPPIQTWRAFAEWGKLYGSVIFASVLGRPIVIVNSASAARDLMEKKGTNFSDRPNMTVLNLIGWGVILPALPYGSAEYRKQRRLMQQYLGPSVISSYDSLIEDRVQKFIRRLCVYPDKFYEEIHGHIASILVKAVYGHDVPGDPGEDRLIVLNERVATLSGSTGNLGATFLDFFPSLRHVPSWIPGMGLKRKALEIRDLLEFVISFPFEKVKSEKAAGTANHSVVYQLLEEYDASSEKSAEEELGMKNFAVTFYNAGTGTSRVVLQMFVLMMVFNQGVQKRAQEEIDRTVGLDRLPLPSDRPSLPFIDCILKEVLRIHPPTPLGVPHSSTQTDEYRGWKIPARSLVIPNIWYMMRDEKVFPDPETFDPDRHNVQGHHQRSGNAISDDLVSPVFGFGRRFCPGRAFAESIICTTMANMLAAFDILPWKDPATGEEILPVVEFEGMTVTAVKPFKCRIVPRSERLALIG